MSREAARHVERDRVLADGVGKFTRASRDTRHMKRFIDAFGDAHGDAGVLLIRIEVKRKGAIGHQAFAATPNDATLR